MEFGGLGLNIKKLVNEIIDDISHYRHWIKTGLYYKYPLCCILFFTFIPMELRRSYYFVTNEHGYVPCPLHRFILLGKCKITNKLIKIASSKTRIKVFCVK